MIVAHECPSRSRIQTHPWSTQIHRSRIQPCLSDRPSRPEAVEEDSRVLLALFRISTRLEESFCRHFQCRLLPDQTLLGGGKLDCNTILFVQSPESGSMSRQQVSFNVPFDSIICFAIEAIFLLRLSFIYSAHFKSHPILTTMVTNSLLNGISDTFAQTMTTMRERARHLDQDKEARLDAIREEYDLPAHASTEILKGAERPFDYERLSRFLCYGFVSAVLQFKWFMWLEDTFPIAGHAAVLKRLVADQSFYAPFSLCLFFAFMNLMEGNSLADLKKRLQKQYARSKCSTDARLMRYIDSLVL